MQLKFVLREFRGEKIISPDGVRGGMRDGKNFLEEMSAIWGGPGRMGGLLLIVEKEEYRQFTSPLLKFQLI